MTVVATFRKAGIPILVGDALLTTVSSTTQFVVPTAPDFESPHFRSVGFCRKAIIISRRFVVGWSGDASRAEFLLRAIRRQFSAAVPTEMSIRSYLSTLPASPSGHVSLIGWFVDKEPRPFHWESANPTGLVFDECFVEGSGKDLFTAMLESPRQIWIGPGVSVEESANLSSLSLLSYLHKAEIENGVTIADRFGFSYDLIVWQGAGFAYLPSYSISTGLFTVDSHTRKLRYQFKNPILTYTAFQSNSVLSLISIAEGPGPDGGYPASVDGPHIVPSVFGEGCKTYKKPKISTDFLCVFAEVFDESGPVCWGPICSPRGEAKGQWPIWITKSQGREIFEFKIDVVLEMYDRAIELRRVNQQ